MATFGPQSANTLNSISAGGTVQWTDAGNAGVSDNTYTTCVLLLDEVSEYLAAVDFQFALPNHSVINGILVEVERNATLNSITDHVVRLILGDDGGGQNYVYGATNKSAGATWPNSDAYASFGSSTDTWGETLTHTDVNSDAQFNVVFGVAMSCKATLLAGTASVDHVRMTIYYTVGSMPHNMVRVARVGGGLSRNESAK